MCPLSVVAILQAHRHHIKTIHQTAHGKGIGRLMIMCKWDDEVASQAGAARVTIKEDS